MLLLAAPMWGSNVPLIQPWRLISLSRRACALLPIDRPIPQYRVHPYRPVRLHLSTKNILGIFHQQVVLGNSFIFPPLVGYDLLRRNSGAGPNQMSVRSAGPSMKHPIKGRPKLGIWLLLNTAPDCWPLAAFSYALDAVNPDPPGR